MTAVELLFSSAEPAERAGKMGAVLALVVPWLWVWLVRYIVRRGVEKTTRAPSIEPLVSLRDSGDSLCALDGRLKFEGDLFTEMNGYSRPLRSSKTKSVILEVFYELPVSFEAGDAITVRCGFANPTGERVIAGARTQDEMCFAFTYVTPPPTGGVVCRPGGSGMTACNIDITPSIGTSETDFSASWDSDGTSCTWALDGAEQGPIGCAGMTETRLPLGNHVFTLNVAGPGGSHSCEATATVTAVGGAMPTCSATITPASGNASTEFTTTWMSDGTVCTWDLNGVPQTDIECSGSVMGMFPVGTHTVTLHSTGPGGMSSCTSAPIIVR